MAITPAIIPSSPVMTSREIAELAGKRHDHVMRDIRAMITELHGENSLPNFGSTYTDSQNKVQPCFSLPKDETLCLMAGYDVKSRMAIIKRWQELETGLYAIPKTLSAALLLASQQAEQIERLELQAKADAPKVEFAEAVRRMDGSCKLGDFGKSIGIGRNKLFQKLRDDEILMATNLPYQRYIDNECFVVIEQTPYTDRDGKSHPTFTTMVTGKGQVFLEKKYRTKA